VLAWIASAALHASGSAAGQAAGVIDLTAQNQEWLVVDDQCEAVIALLSR
jgi:hypothetical protein